MAEEDTEYIKLPVEDRCVHKLWKARVHGYEEATKLFRQIPDEKSPEWNKYLGLMKKFVADSNAAAQEKGLEAVLAYVESAGPAGKTVGEVMSNIVTKCLAAPKAKTKELSVQIALMYIEIERHEAVMEEIIKGFDQKNPKVVAACVNVATLALREYGNKVIAVKPLVKEIPKVLDHRDKIVRDEGKALMIEMYRWVGAALRPQLNNLKPVQVAELEPEFDKVSSEKVTPTRYLRSQQQRQQHVEEAAVDGDDDGGGEDVDDGPAAVDPYDLLEPVDILSKLPKDFYEKLEAKKWQERKEAMDELEKLLQNPKLESGDYGDLIRALKKIITKDINVLIVAMAGKSLACLANGLKKRFQPYAHACVSCIFEKFREKKQNVVTAMKEAIDAVTQFVSLEQMQEDIIEALNNKNPAVKAETASFLSRYFTKCTPQMLDRKMLKALTPALIKTLNESDPVVRDNSAEALGTAMKVVSEKAIMPYIGDVDKLKLEKINEFCAKAVITAKVTKTPRPATAPVKSAPTSNKPVPVKRPGASAPAKKPAPKRTGGAPAAGKSKAPAKKTAAAAPTNVERELADEEVDETASELLSPDILSGLVDGNWKTRLAAAEQMLQTINGMEKADIPSQVFVRTVNKKPGLRDGNFQVLKAKFDVVKALAENSKFTRTTANFCLQDVADKLGDTKTGSSASETLIVISEATKLDFVATEVVTFAFSQKSPRLQQESMIWLSNAIREFGFVIQPKPVIENVRKALASTNVGVRTAGVTLLGTMFLYMGDHLRPLVDGEKPSLLQQINAEFEKYEGQQPPIPTRGMTVSTGEDASEGADDDDLSPDPSNLQDLLPRTDISDLVTESMLSELADKNWKIRDEALQRIASTINNTKYICGNLGELPAALAARMQDSNRNIAVTAFSLCKHLGTALGTQCKQHLRILLPAMLQGLGDSKNQIRGLAMECIKAWADQCGVKELFDGEMIADALKTGNPFLRSELFTWLAENLTDAKGVPKDELVACLPYLMASVEDRSADVRKNSQDAILPFMIHVGYEAMNRQLSKLPTSSRTSVSVMLDKARAMVPAKPVVTKSKPGQQEIKSKLGVSKIASKPAAAASSKPKAGGVAKPGASRRKEEELDTSPLLQVNNLKNQRMSDEQKFKVLKWNFTTPREEFIDMLKDQMTTAGVNKSLMSNMFHADFKYHLKAIDSLNEYLGVDPTATTSNLDLILKWLTLRFFDTNPSVLLRGLEYLHSVFVMLAEDGYNMLEIEAASFVPYLILKSGDPKDTVRNSVRAIMQQITLVYSCSKLFAYVMEGLKSKNSRQRTECLEELGTLIENYGISVCQPTPAAALKEIAKQISDRDNSVRTAALNCVVQAWYQEGERIYKMIGQISDKDFSLLTERIKRAGKNRPTIRAAPEPMSKPTKVVRPHVVNHEPSNGMKETHDRYHDGEEVELNYRPARTPEVVLLSSSDCNDCMSSASALNCVNLNVTYNMEDTSEEVAEPNTEQNVVRGPRPISGKFCLDYNMLEEMEDPKSLRGPNLVEMDLEAIIESDVHLPNIDQPKLAAAVTSPVGGSTAAAAAVELYVGRLCNHSLERSTEACREVEAMLRRESSKRVLVPLTDQLLMAITNQLQLLHKASHETHDIQHMSTNYTLLITILRMIFAMPDMACRASQSVIRDLMSSLLSMLVEQKLERFPTEDQITRLTNSLVVRIIENSEHTKLINAQLRMLYECIANPNTPPKFTELVMKSLWKVMRIIEKWEDSLDFASVLREVNHFLADFPTHSWRDRSNQVPLKTVKTLVHTMVQMKGSSLLTYLSKDEMCPELLKIINKYITTTAKPEKTQNNTAKEGMSPHKISKLTHHQLSVIFKKIGSKEHTQEGLEQLYDFQKLHPDEDIAPFLERASQFFQDFVEKGLKTVEKNRMRQGSNSASSLSPQVADTPSDSSESALFMRPNVGNEEGVGGDSAKYYIDRLKELKTKAGFGRTNDLQLTSTDNQMSDINRNRRQPEELLNTIPRTIPGDTSPPKSSEMEQLLQRLERFKR